MTVEDDGVEETARAAVHIAPTRAAARLTYCPSRVTPLTRTALLPPASPRHSPTIRIRHQAHCAPSHGPSPRYTERTLRQHPFAALSSAPVREVSVTLCNEPLGQSTEETYDVRKRRDGSVLQCPPFVVRQLPSGMAAMRSSADRA